MFTTRALKAASLLVRPRLAKVALLQGVAASTEHLAAIRLCEPHTLIDAGANKGQFSLAFRYLRPDSTIVAFEPLPSAADKFEALFSADANARLYRVALGRLQETKKFYVAERADSSSLLELTSDQLRAFNVAPAFTIDVPVRRLDQVLDLTALRHPVLLKVDVQGGELEVFEGCDQLALLDFIYVELSFVELYLGQPLFPEVTNYLAARGFQIAGVFNQVTTNAFGPTQVDVLFRRRSSEKHGD